MKNKYTFEDLMEAHNKKSKLQHFIEDVIWEIKWYFYRVPRSWFIEYIKFPYQRIVRGYDDNFIWEYKSVHTRQIIEILKYYRFQRMGTPSSYVLKKYNKLLDTAIAGFTAHLAMDDLWLTDKKTYSQYKKLDKVFKKGLEAYIELYPHLWD